MPQTIDISAGGTEYSNVISIVEQTGKNISAVPIQVALGDWHAPGTWRSPDIDHVVSLSERTVQVLIDDTVPTGSLWIWVKVQDTPEVIVRRVINLVIT